VAVGKRSSERALQKVLGKGGNVNEANPLEVHDPKVGSLISYEGVTTADGAGDGSTLIDSVLATKPDYDGHWVVITSGPYFGQCSDITGATTGGTVAAHEAFDGQIVSGTKFVILAMKALPAEVAALTALVIALMADVGDPTGETLGSLAAKWGDIARSLDLILGARWDGAGDLGTDIAAIIAGLATIAGYLDTEIAAILAAVDTEVAAIETKLDTPANFMADVTKIYREQIPDTDVDEEVTATETDCVLVNLGYIADKSYCLRHLRLKCADPGVGRTVTIKLYERWNDAIAQLIDSFDITPDNYGTYHSLMDMFGVPEIHSDAILIRAVHDGASPADDAAIEVTYRYAEATT